MTQQTFNCAKPTIETLQKGKKMFKINVKDRMTLRNEDLFMDILN